MEYKLENSWASIPISPICELKGHQMQFEDLVRKFCLMAHHIVKH